MKFRAVDLSSPRGRAPREIGVYASLQAAQDAAEALRVPASIFEGYHLRGYTSGDKSGRKEFPNQGFKFAHCPCSACQGGQP